MVIYQCKDTTLSLKIIVFYGEYLFYPFKTIISYYSTAIFMDFTKHELQDNANQILLLTFARMNAIKNIFISGLCLLSLTGCDLIDYHPYDAKIDGAKHINAQNMSALSATRLDGRKSVSP